MKRFPFWFATLLAGVSLAALPAAAQQQEEKGGSGEGVDGGEVPDAMGRIPKAPPADIKNIRDPFASYLELVASRGKAILEERKGRLEKREREVLENFDLSTLKLVAIIKMGESRVAMVEDSTGKGYIVRRGNYMGRNNGRIEKITGDTLFLIEQVINPAGELVERQVTMTLREVNE